jgi:integrase
MRSAGRRKSRMSGTSRKGGSSERRLPPYVREFIDRHGKLRRYFRRKGYESEALPTGAIASPEFQRAYRAAMAGETPKRIGPTKLIPGSVRATLTDYLRSSAFKKLAPSTQRKRRLYLLAFCDRQDGKGTEFGDKRVSRIEFRHVDPWLADMRPSAAINLRAALRGLFNYAIKLKLRSDDPTQGVELAARNRKGWHTWTEAEIAQFEAKFPPGTKKRLAEAFAVFLAPRCETISRLGPQHIQNGRIVIHPTKTEHTTGFELDAPIHPELARIIKATPPSGHLTYLVTRYGTPYTSDALTQFFKNACVEAGLPHCSIHGLRKAACRRLAEAGASAMQIASITGHTDLKTLEIYVKDAEKRRLADGAIKIMTRAHPAKSETGTSGVKPRTRFAKKRL